MDRVVNGRDKSRPYKRGGYAMMALSLLELLIALTLLTVVLLTASSLLITFKKFYSDLVKEQGEVEDVSLIALEEVVNRIKVAKDATITEKGSKIDIEVEDVEGSNDATYTYWKVGSSIKYIEQIEGEPRGPVTNVADHIGLLNFEFQPAAAPEYNRVKIKIGVIPTDGAQQDFETTVIMRARSAQQD